VMAASECGLCMPLRWISRTVPFLQDASIEQANELELQR
jgi:hypothetical protein